MSNRSEKQRRRQKRKTKRSSGEPADVRRVEYEIVTEPIYDPADRTPQAVEDQTEELFDLVHDHPQQAVSRLEALLEKYPGTPRLYNYLAVAHGRLGHKEQYERAVEENYRVNPRYLFAKCNYAQLLLDHGRATEVAAVFEDKFDLSMLYPNRRRFHITEATSFFGVMAVYYSAIGKMEAANNTLAILKNIAPDHPMTRQVERQMGLGLVSTALRKLMAKVTPKTQTESKTDVKTPPPG